MQDGETLESALRRFKRKVQQEDIIKEIKRHSFYLKPGEKRRTEGSTCSQTQSQEAPDRYRVAVFRASPGTGGAFC